MLVALTLLANLAISGIASLFVKPDSATGKSVKDVTGVDTRAGVAYGTRSRGLRRVPVVDVGEAADAAGSLSWRSGRVGDRQSQRYGQRWSAWLRGPADEHVLQRPSDCSNAMPMAFSNVLVAVSIADMVRAIAVQAAQGAVSAGVSAGVDRVNKSRERAARMTADVAGRDRTVESCPSISLSGNLHLDYQDASIRGRVDLVWSVVTAAIFDRELPRCWGAGGSQGMRSRSRGALEG
jgi:hypothetical protein